jgi:heat shock protein HslJ
MKNNLFAVPVLALLLVTACSAPVLPTGELMTEPSSDADRASVATPAAAEEMPEAPAESETTDLDMLISHPWQWVSFSNPELSFEVDLPANYTLTFGEDGIVEIVADCNTAIANYRVVSTDAGSLSMNVAPRTTDTCSPAARGDQFLTLLATAAEYAYVDGQLHITLMADGGTMVFVPAAADNGTGATGDAFTASPGQLVETLGNLAYSGLFPDRTIALTDGVAFYEEEGPGTPFVLLMDQIIATGDLDGNGVEDAAVLLEDHSVGSGTFLFLAPVLDAATEPTPLTALMVGDRVQVKSLAIEGDQVVADLIAQGASDPACCPTWNVRKRFAVQDGALVERSSEELSPVGLADLSDTNWRLVDLGDGQAPILPDTEITLAITDGQISGSGGCNTYTGSLTEDEELLQSFVVGPVAATRMLCADAVSAQETVYLALLESVLGWRYDGGELALAYPGSDDIYGYLRFAPE